MRTARRPDQPASSCPGVRNGTDQHVRFRGGGWKRDLWWNCAPTPQPKGRGWKPSTYGCARQCPTRRTGIEGKSRVKIRGGSGTAFPVILRSAAQFVAKAEPVRQGICVQEPEARCDDENPNCQPEPEPVHLCVAGAACGQLFST